MHRLRRKSLSWQSGKYGCYLFPWLPSLFPRMFPWQPIHQASSSSARTCPLCFMGASWRLSAPETPIPSRAFVGRAAVCGMELGWAGSQASHPWDCTQVALLRQRVISERRPHTALSSPLTGQHSRGSLLWGPGCKPAGCETWAANQKWQQVTPEGQE